MYFGFYTCIIELILVLRNVYLYIGAHPCISDLIRVLRNLYLYKSTHRYYTYSLYGDTRRYYWTYFYFTELVLMLPIRKYP